MDCVSFMCYSCVVVIFDLLIVLQRRNNQAAQQCGQIMVGAF